MTVQKLADIDEQIEDKWIFFVMRNGVSTEYESFVAALNQQLKERSKSEDIKIALLGENERRRVKGESTSAKVLLSKQSKKHQCNKHKPGQKIKCYECGDPTHKRPDCPKLNQDSKKKQKLKTQQVSMDQDTSKKNTTLLTKALTAKMSPLTWIIDSGATTHMVRDKDSLCDLDLSVHLLISVADDSEIKSEGAGKAILKFKDCNPKNVKTATDVLYVPNLSANLLSVSRMTEKDYNVVFDRESCKIFDESNFKITGNLEFVCAKKDGLYCVDNISQESVRAMSAACVSDHELWHKR